MKLAIRSCCFFSLSLSIWFSCLFCRAAPAEEQTDTGATDQITLAQQAFNNKLAELGNSVPAGLKIAALKQYERELSLAKPKDENRKVDKYTELHRVARDYWNLRSFDEATRVCLQIIDETGKSKVSAKAWYIIAKIQFGNRMDAAAAIEPYENADSILEELSKTSDDPEILSLRSSVLNQLGDAHIVCKNKERAAETYRRFLEDKKMVKAANLPQLLNANLELSRYYVQIGKAETAAPYFDNIEGLLDSKDAPAMVVIPSKMERIRGKWRDSKSPERIKALEEVWNSKRFEDDPRILLVGNELTLHYFFSGVKPAKQFDAISEEFLRRSRKFKVKFSDSALQAELADFYPYYGENLLVRAQSLQLAGKTKERDVLLDEFRKVFEKRQFRIVVSGDNPVEYPNKIAGLYLAFFKADDPGHTLKGIPLTRPKDGD
jgi:hypothetical protein